MTLRVLTPYRVSNPFHRPHTELVVDDTFSVWQIIKTLNGLRCKSSPALLVSVILKMMAANASVYIGVPPLCT